MEEWVLNDLLECSVCLERLDTSSRVLPCQHTFCKKCLEEIVHTHKKLRCPECRILVEIGVEDLPPNVLLMRILEGMRNAPRKETVGSGAQSSSGSASSSCEVQKGTPFLDSSKSENKVSQTQRPKGVDMPKPYAIALYNFSPKEAGDLSFQKGDLIYLRRKIDNNWYQGECNGVSGVFPLPYVKVVVPLPPAPNATRTPQCKALYDFNRYREDDEGCLHFNKGDVISVIRRIDENWAEGKLDDKIGIFPISFVEMNHMGKALMTTPLRDNHNRSRDAPTPPSDESIPLISGDQSRNVSTTFSLNQTQLLGDGVTSGVTSPLSTSSSSAQSTATTNSPTSSSDSTTSSSPTLSPLSNHAVIKRHSYTMGAFPSSYQNTPTTLRHSTEIINATDSHSLQNNTDIVQHGMSHQQPSSSSQNAEHSFPHFSLQYRHQQQQQQNRQPSSTTDMQFPQHTCQKKTAKSEQKEHTLQKSPQVSSAAQGNESVSRNSFFHLLTPAPSLPARYIALYPYKPQKNDELELRKDSIYIVTQRCEDGWYKGTTLRGHKSGVFPGNYVAPIKSLSALEAQIRGLIINSRGVTRPSSDVQISTSSVKPIVAANISKSGSDRTSSSDWKRAAPPELPPRSLSPLLPVTSHQSNSTWYQNIGESGRNFALSGSRSTTSVTKSTNSVSTSSSSSSLVPPDLVPTSFTMSTPPVSSTKIPEKSGKERKERYGLMKKFTAIRKSRSPPPSTFSVDNPVFEEGFSTQMSTFHGRSDSCPSQLVSYNNASPISSNSTGNSTAANFSTSTTAVTPSHRRLYNPSSSHRVKSKTRPALHANSFSNAEQHRSFKLPGSKDERPVVSHQKSSSLDTANMMSLDDLMLFRNRPASSVKERKYRCIVPYPPNSEFELDLKIGDIIYVNKKREDGWYKGTLQRSGRTGLFPASFVEPV